MATTIIVSQILDNLVDAVEKARIDATGDQRWLNAIDTAYSWLLLQDTILYDLDHHELTVPSATFEGITYRANGSCQCESFNRSKACWHRAAARLVRRARELRTQQAVAAAEAAEKRELRRRTAYSEMAELFA